MFKKVHVIVNPASGKDQPILNTLNSVFHPADVEWDVSITQKAGDGKRFAQQAAAKGYEIVAAYGGDGTVMEVANGLMGTGVPMAILPGGTANVLSVELGIPGELAKAAGLLVGGSNKIHDVDMGLLNDQHLFILRFATGFEAEMDIRADRQLKDKFGKLSYTLAGIMAIRNPLKARYQFTLDGKEAECEGVTCMVANTSNLGIQGVDISKNTDVSDGLLDVIVLGSAEQDLLKSIMTFSVNRSDEEIQKDLSKLTLVNQWQAKEIYMEANPPQNMIIDGEPIGKTPCKINVLPKAVRILVPDA